MRTLVLLVALVLLPLGACDRSAGQAGQTGRPNAPVLGVQPARSLAAARQAELALAIPEAIVLAYYRRLADRDHAGAWRLWGGGGLVSQLSAMIAVGFL